MEMQQSRTLTPEEIRAERKTLAGLVSAQENIEEASFSLVAGFNEDDEILEKMAKDLEKIASSFYYKLQGHERDYYKERNQQK